MKIITRPGGSRIIHCQNITIYYQNCQAITRLHFPTEYLNTLTKSLEIDYLTFY